MPAMSAHVYEHYMYTLCVWQKNMNKQTKQKIQSKTHERKKKNCRVEVAITSAPANARQQQTPKPYPNTISNGNEKQNTNTLDAYSCLCLNANDFRKTSNKIMLNLFIHSPLASVSSPFHCSVSGLLVHIAISTS